MPSVSFPSATEMSSLAASEAIVAFAAVPRDFDFGGGGYGSPANTAFAYSLGSKSWFENTL